MNDGKQEVPGFDVLLACGLGYALADDTLGYYVEWYAVEVWVGCGGWAFSPDAVYHRLECRCQFG